ncbi:hypothetical protein IMZ48_43015 [Candidatus Bathyarchaeota archaeon]|nr:hypothetical protein [Candidatus Bathyarchaeota archaeon]
MAPPALPSRYRPSTRRLVAREIKTATPDLVGQPQRPVNSHRQVRMGRRQNGRSVDGIGRRLVLEGQWKAAWKAAGANMSGGCEIWVAGVEIGGRMFVSRVRGDDQHRVSEPCGSLVSKFLVRQDNQPQKAKDW